jgi:hypothetical protein
LLSLVNALMQLNDPIASAAGQAWRRDRQYHLSLGTY